MEAKKDEVSFEVSMRNIGNIPKSGGVHLFCLQTGGIVRFHDFEGVNTFVLVEDRWVSVKEMIAGKFPSHRMCGFKVVSGLPQQGKEVTGRLMAKEGKDNWILAIALDIGYSLSCNHQIWPSCIHANPVWSELAPGKEQTAHGKVYYFRGSREELLERYKTDFGS